MESTTNKIDSQGAKDNQKTQSEASSQSQNADAFVKGETEDEIGNLQLDSEAAQNNADYLDSNADNLDSNLDNLNSNVNNLDSDVDNLDSGLQDEESGVNADAEVEVLDSQQIEDVEVSEVADGNLQVDANDISEAGDDGQESNYAESPSYEEEAVIVDTPLIDEAEPGIYGQSGTDAPLEDNGETQDQMVAETNFNEEEALQEDAQQASDLDDSQQASDGIDGELAEEQEFASESEGFSDAMMNQDNDSTIQNVSSEETESSAAPTNENRPSTPFKEEVGAPVTAPPVTAPPVFVENRCGECNGELGRDDPRTIYKQTAYHPRCFACYECKSEKLSGLNGFYVNGGRRYCVDCYNRNVAERCTSCSEAILEGGVRHRNRPFHQKCFKCAGCETVLSQTPFVWRDQRTLCLPCYTDKFAEKCCKCSASIQPGEQYLQVEGMRFHDNCLICDICGDQLQDHPFVQDGKRNVCVNCSTNGFQSHKQKEGGAAAAVTAPTTLEVPSPKSVRSDNDDGMDLKDWISRPSGATNKESNKNSLEMLSPNIPAAPPNSPAAPPASSWGEQDAATNAMSGGSNAESRDTSTADDTITNAASYDATVDAALRLEQNDNAAKDGGIAVKRKSILSDEHNLKASQLSAISRNSIRSSRENHDFDHLIFAIKDKDKNGV